MGKDLIIKGADFFANGIVNYKALNFINNALSVTSSGYGAIGGASPVRGCISEVSNGTPVAILVPTGKAIKIKGLKGINPATTEALYLDYVYYASETMTHENAVGTCSNYDSSNFFPLNHEGADEIVIQNTYGNDYYFAFAAKGANGGNILSASYSLEYAIINP